MARGAIAYKGQLYLGGSKVEANPTGSAEGGNLSKLGVDDTVYAIPQVNNGTLTIQKNGTNVATFSANQSENVTANIDVSEDIAGTQTVSGNPITLTDAAPINAEKLEVELEPKQDLHGQDAPYVGGAGKNKLPLTVDGLKSANTDGTWTGNAYTLYGVTFTINTDADGNVTSLKVNGTASATIFFKLCDFPVCLTDGTSYKINGNASGYGSSTAYLQVQTSNGGGVANVGSEYTLAYTSGGTAQRLIIRIDTNENPSNLVFYPMIRLATETDPTFAPYSNICPITGYDECEIKTLTDIQSYYDIQTIVRSGKAQDVFNIGDEIPVKYTATNGTQYDMPFRVVAFQNVELQDGTTKQGMFLQSVYATLEEVQFDHPENEKVTEETYQDGMTYYQQVSGDNWKRLVAGTDYTVGDTITDRNIVHSKINDSSGYIVTYGYNRWKHSAIRQWLNSDKAAGQWWTAQHEGDVAPDQLASIRGFLAGLPAEFVEVLGKPKMTQALNTVSEPDKTLTEEDTYDKIFLASLEQMYTTPQVGSGKEGTYFDYWKRALGLSSPSSRHPSTYEAYKTYALENHNSAQYVRLRSAYRGYSYSTWYVFSGGFIYDAGAYYALRSAPVCVIC